MTDELVVFWRYPDGTRCVVAPNEHAGWQLCVIRAEEPILTENYTDPHQLLARAQQLRAEFKSSAA